MVVREFDTYLSVVVPYAVPLAHSTNIIRFGFNAFHRFSIYRRARYASEQITRKPCTPKLDGLW